jgi:single-stranded DNA-binding protein
MKMKKTEKENNLNSLLIEGKVTKRILDKCKDGTDALLIILSTNYYTPEGKCEKTFTQVKAFGKLAISAYALVKKGTGIRVIGRLSTYNTQLLIVAESIVTRPYQGR